MQTHQLMLMYMIQCGRDVGDLRRQGLEYHQIAGLIEMSIDASLLAWQDDRLVLTEKGNEQLAQEKRNDIGGGVSAWIVPDENSRIDRRNHDDVYLPKVTWRQ